MSTKRLHKVINRLRRQHMPDGVMTEAYIESLLRVLIAAGIVADEGKTNQDGHRIFTIIGDWNHSGLQEICSVSSGRLVSEEEMMEKCVNKKGQTLAQEAEELRERIKQLRAQFGREEGMTQEHFEALQAALVESSFFADLGDTNSKGGRVLVQSRRARQGRRPLRYPSDPLSRGQSVALRRQRLTPHFN